MDYKTNTKWVIWYHSIHDKDWSNDSYKKIFEINNLFDLFYFKNNITNYHLFDSMIFVMREDIFPTWEDSNNKKGGLLCYKINSDNILNEFIDVLESCVCENIHIDSNNYNKINGISISPKKEFNILKLWIRDRSNDKILNYKTNYINSKNMQYKKN